MSAVLGAAVRALLVASLAAAPAAAGCSRSALRDPRSTRPAAGGRVLFVSPDGADGASGSREAPLRSVQAAADAARPGDVVRILPGSFDERVDFASDGTEEAPVTYEAAGEVVIARGFRVTGDRNVIRGLTVTPGEPDPRVFEAEMSQSSFLLHTTGQIQVTGSHNVLEGIGHHDEEHVTPAGVSALAFLGGSHNVVRDIDFHDCASVFFAGNERERPGSGRHNSIRGGTLHHTNGAMIMIDADDATLEGLDLHHPGQVDKRPESSDAADAINLNGRRITIRGCRIHSIFAQVPTQHADAIQWWGHADDLVIEGNVIGSAARGGDLGLHDQGHIQWTSETPGKTSRRAIVRNNVFLGTEVPYAVNGSPEQVIPGQADDWAIVGNTFVGAQSIRPDLVRACSGWLIANNVFHSSSPYEGADGTLRLDHNCYVGAELPPGEGEGSISVPSAGFVDPDVSESARYGVDADWRPSADSPLAGAGMGLEELRKDKDGIERPERPAIGALEPPPAR